MKPAAGYRPLAYFLPGTCPNTRDRRNTRLTTPRKLMTYLTSRLASLIHLYAVFS